MESIVLDLVVMLVCSQFVLKSQLELFERSNQTLVALWDRTLGRSKDLLSVQISLIIMLH